MAAHAYRLSALISLLLFALAATAAGTTTKTPMQLQLFDATPGLQCSDGSAHGVYVEGPERPAGWVLWISGGGACRNATDCRRKLKKDPWKFGSSSWPSTIGGDSLLSADKETNPETFAYEKWMVPYCSQVRLPLDASPRKATRGFIVACTTTC